MTSYIDTAVLAATRATDVASIDFAPPGDFTILAEVDLRRAEAENAIVSLIGVSPDDRVMLLRDATGHLAIEIRNAGTAAHEVGPVRGAGAMRCAISVGGTRAPPRLMAR